MIFLQSTSPCFQVLKITTSLFYPQQGNQMLRLLLSWKNDGQLQLLLFAFCVLFRCSCRWMNLSAPSCNFASLQPVCCKMCYKLDNTMFISSRFCFANIDYNKSSKMLLFGQHLYPIKMRHFIKHLLYFSWTNEDACEKKLTSTRTWDYI